MSLQSGFSSLGQQSNAYPPPTIYITVEQPRYYETYAILDPKPDDKDGKSQILLEHSVKFYQTRKDAETDLQCDAYEILRLNCTVFSARKKLQRVRYVVKAITNG